MGALLNWGKISLDCPLGVISDTEDAGAMLVSIRWLEQATLCKLVCFDLEFSVSALIQWIVVVEVVSRNPIPPMRATMRDL
jgi:hypothetical protein